MPGLRGKYVNHRMHGPSCAFHGAVRDILSRYRSALRYVPRRANRSRLDRARADSERENDRKQRFHRT
jgi:hypothetical protein